jgi:hypothetical protein
MQNLVAQVTRHLRFMHPSFCLYLYSVYVDIPCDTERGITAEHFGGEDGMHLVLTLIDL